MFSCEFCESSKNTFFTENLRTTACVTTTMISYNHNFMTSKNIYSTSQKPAIWKNNFLLTVTINAIMVLVIILFMLNQQKLEI